MAATRNSPCTDVEEVLSACLHKYCSAGQTVTVAFSGGLDSTVLLHASLVAARAQNLCLGATHVHHGLSKNADHWQIQCAQFCERADIPFSAIKIDVPRNSGTGLENAARQLRHRVLESSNSDWILLAHHGDDQAETLLLNLFRGAGVLGAAGIPERQGKFLRPLLSVSRTSLLAHAERFKLKWIEDESNLDIRYSRNFVRQRLRPVLEDRFPGAMSQLAAATVRFAEAQALLDELAQIDLAADTHLFPIPLDRIRSISATRATNLLRWMLTANGQQSPDHRRMREFVRQLQTAGPDRHPQIQLGRFRLRVARKLLHFEKCPFVDPK